MVLRRSPLIYATPNGLVADDAHTFARRTLRKPDSVVYQEPVQDSGENALAVSPDLHTVYLTFWALDALGNARTDYLDRWSLPSGRRLPRIVLGTRETTLRLLDHGSRLAILKDNKLTLFDTQTMQPVRSVSFSAGAEERASSPTGPSYGYLARHLRAVRSRKLAASVASVSDHPACSILSTNSSRPLTLSLALPCSFIRCPPSD